jgi:hypothetical protein
VRHQAGGLIHFWEAHFEDLEGLLIVTLEHLNVRINHLVKWRRVCIAQIAERRVGGCAEVRIFLAPRIVEQAATGCQHLGACQKNWIVGASAYLHGLFHRGEALVGINEAKRPHQGSQCAHLSCLEASPSCS